MSAHTLLTFHNLAVLEAMMAGARSTISIGTFEQELRLFEKRYDGGMGVLREAEKKWRSVDRARGFGKSMYAAQRNFTDINPQVEPDKKLEYRFAVRCIPSIPPDNIGNPGEADQFYAKTQAHLTIMPTELKVVVSGTKFVLTQDQFKVDGPNYFTDAVAAHAGRFFGPQAKVSRNPELFKLVVDFLNGYAVLPKDAPLPKGMPCRKVALKNLIAEAKFYRLNSLEAIAEEILRKLDVGYYLE
ncbi:hypothetical protein FRC06_002193 [Ceratobasidium sp. 370]|nr:hypothetical protein FRC06_002193 [Ceratobasidium sp. 370]